MCQLELSGDGSFVVFSEVLSLFRRISNPTPVAALLDNLIMQCKKRGQRDMLFLLLLDMQLVVMKTIPLFFTVIFYFLSRIIHFMY